MAEVFISYAREDRDRAAVICQLLTEIDVSVFLDERSIQAGESFPKIIDRELKSARAVVALWSPHSLSRPWVIQECMVGKEVSVLIPLVIKTLDRRKDVPVNFFDTHTIDFEDFDGSRVHPSWPKLIDALASALHRSELVDADAKLRPAGAPIPPRPLRRRKTPWLPIAAAAGVVAIAGLGTAGYVFRDTLFPAQASATPAPAPEPAFDEASLAPTGAGAPIVPFANNLPATGLREAFKGASPVTAELLICGNPQAVECLTQPAEPDGHVIFYNDTVIRLRVTSAVKGHLLVLAHMPNGVIEVMSPRRDAANAPPEGQLLTAGQPEPVPAVDETAIHALMEDQTADTEVGQWIFIVVPSLQASPTNIDTLISQYLHGPEDPSPYRTSLAGLDRLVKHIKPGALRYGRAWGYGTLTYEMKKP